MQWECGSYEQLSGDHDDENVYVSTAGHLPCKHIINVIGPVWQGLVWQGTVRLEEADFRSAVFKSLMAAEQHGFSSVAIPAPGSQSFGIPIGISTESISSTVRDFLACKRCVRKISLVDPANDVVDAFRNSLGIAFGSQMVTTRFDGYDTSQGEGQYCFSSSTLDCFY